MKNQIIHFLFSLILISCISDSLTDDYLPDVIIRKDNSFVSYSDTSSKREKVPIKIFQKITEIIEMNFYETKYEKDKIDAIFKVKYNSQIDIYIVRLKSFGVLYYTILGYTPISEELTSKPLYFDGKSMVNNEEVFAPKYRLLDAPLLYLKDYDEDGKEEIIIKERKHNGTVYDAVVESYYSIDDEMNIKLVSVIESKYIHFYYDDCLITRDLKKNIITVRIKCKDDEILDVGEVYLSHKENKIQIDSTKLFIEKYKGLLITGSGLDEETFLNEGYNFDY